MKNLKKTVEVIAIAALLSIAGLCRAQGPMVYSLPLLAVVPPSYPGEAVDVSAAYILFDLAMRRYSSPTRDKFISQMAWGDTAKYVAGMVYKVMHDNPIAFAQYDGWFPGYTDEPGHTWGVLLSQIANVCPDTGRTAALINANIIADVLVTDTIGGIDSTALYAKNMVLVTCSILDSIKGKYVPACPELLKSQKKGASPQLLTPTPFPTYAVSAAPGTYIQFEYCLEWRRTSSTTGDVGIGTNPLYDSINGTWIKPDSEYIVFLNFQGLGSNSTGFNFATWPILQGSCAGMYPVRGGLVYDPNDDYGIGASSGLTVSVWKSRLRARIS